MRSYVLFYNTEKNKASFVLTSGTRPRGILMLTAAGKYTLKFPETGQSYVVFPNMITYIPPNVPFIRKVEDPIHFHQFHVQCALDDPFAQSLTPGILPIPQEQVSAICKSLSCLPSAAYRAELIQHMFQQILTENYLFSPQVSRPMLSDDVCRVIQYMQQHLSEHISLDTLAAVAGLSRSGLMWKFRRHFDTTPQKHLTMLRMQLAKQLLLESGLSVTEIAEKCGYGDVYYFSNAFHQNIGVSPTAFRKSPCI